MYAQGQVEIRVDHGLSYGLLLSGAQQDPRGVIVWKRCDKGMEKLNVWSGTFTLYYHLRYHILLLEGVVC
jgi:hypothetical protein